MKNLTREEMEKIDGGLFAGAIVGGIFGFAVGCLTGCAATIYYGDKTGKIILKHMYVGAVFGAMCGTVSPY